MLDVFLEGSSEDSYYGDSNSFACVAASSSREGASGIIPIFSNDGLEIDKCASTLEGACKGTKDESLDRFNDEILLGLDVEMLDRFLDDNDEGLLAHSNMERLSNIIFSLL